MKSIRYMMSLLGFIIFSYSLKTYALVPLEGLLYGDVSDISQQDPLIGITSFNFISDPKLANAEELYSLKVYDGFYQQGINLKNSCQFSKDFKYDSTWAENQAKRTIISTLQYIGLDLTMKSIVEYSKILELDDSSFENLVENLVVNSCSKNTTVYSLKLLKDNFNYLFKKVPAKTFQLPNLSQSPYFSKGVKDITNSRQAKQKELDLTIKNFRALCSWGGDIDNYRLLVPFLKNPFIMSHIYNSLLARKISFDKKKGIIGYEDDKDSVQMSCDNLICRKTSLVRFKQSFPKIVGSIDLKSDLETLYCGHFSKVLFQEVNQNKLIKKWMDELTIDSSILEAANMIALMTKKSDLLIASGRFDDLKTLLKDNIDHSWDNWASDKSSGLQLDLLLEESLNVTLVSQVNTSDSLKGSFNMVFDFTLGEADKVLTETDKIRSSFNLSLPNNFLRWMRKEYIKRSNLSDFKGLEELDRKITAYLEAEFQKKEKYFLIPLWNKKISKIAAKELQQQLLKYKGSRFSAHHNRGVKIPVEFRFGLFALKYLNDKFKSKYRSDNSYRAISGSSRKK